MPDKELTATIRTRFERSGTDQAQKAISDLNKTGAQLAAGAGKFSTTFNQQFIGGLQRGQATMKDFNGLLLDQAQKAGLGTGQMARLAGATGGWTDQQLLAARASANVSAKAAELTKQVAAGTLTAREAGAEFKKYAESQAVVGSTSMTTGSRIAGLVKQIGVMTAALAGVYVVGRKAFDFAEQGAQLDLTSQKFDRLVQRIGTTKDAIMTDLRAATKGLASDAQLMGSATDFMSLGLAKTYDQVVRLSRVSAALGMDMNQLVLTLANQTTMRFDQLGVSVDGFDAKVKTLEATGMSANDAFTEAFLQQAEAQIGKVGEVAETTAGKFAKMNAQMANLTDQAKMFAGVKLEGPVTALGNLLEAENLAQEAMERGIITKKEYHALALKINWTNYTAADAVEYLTGKIAEHTLATRDDRQESIDAMRATQEDTAAKYENIEATNLSALSEGELAQQMFNVHNVTTGYNPVIDELTNNFNELQIAEEWAGKAGERAMLETAAATEAAKRALQEAKAKVDEFYGAIDRNLPSKIQGWIEDLEWQLGGGLELQDKTTAINDALAAGKITPQQAEAMLKAVYVETQGLQVEMDKLTMKEAAKNVEDTLNVKFKDAKELVKEVIKEGNKDMDPALTILASITGDQLALSIAGYLFGGIPIPAWLLNNKGFNPPPGWKPPEQKAVGGPVAGGEAYLVGERGPELFVPGQSGAIVPNNQLGGGRNGSGVTVHNYFTVSSPAAMALALAETERLAGARLNASM